MFDVFISGNSVFGINGVGVPVTAVVTACTNFVVFAVVVVGVDTDETNFVVSEIVVEAEVEVVLVEIVEFVDVAAVVAVNVLAVVVVRSAGIRHFQSLPQLASIEATTSNISKHMLSERLCCNPLHVLPTDLQALAHVCNVMSCTLARACNGFPPSSFRQHPWLNVPASARVVATGIAVVVVVVVV